jgi:exonuclease III
MCNKVCGVIEMLKDRKIDICCLTETWFKAKDGARFAEIHDFGYDVISAPRKGIGGGVAFLFNPKTANPVKC